MTTVEDLTVQQHAVLNMLDNKWRLVGMGPAAYSYQRGRRYVGSVPSAIVDPLREAGLIYRGFITDAGRLVLDRFVAESRRANIARAGDAGEGRT